MYGSWSMDSEPPALPAAGFFWPPACLISLAVIRKELS